jgi:plastocyanin
MKMIFFMALLGVVTLAACTGAPSPSVTANDGETIELTVDETGQYVPREMTVTLGSTVRIKGDPETLIGGMDTVIIDGYGVRQLIAPGDNIIEFVANQPGTFDVYCANGMGNGKLIVR